MGQDNKTFESRAQVCFSTTLSSLHSTEHREWAYEILNDFRKEHISIKKYEDSLEHNAIQNC